MDAAVEFSDGGGGLEVGGGAGVDGIEHVAAANLAADRGGEVDARSLVDRGAGSPGDLADLRDVDRPDAAGGASGYANTEIGQVVTMAYLDAFTKLVADVKHTICQAYDVEFAAAGVAFRGSFLIDKAGIVRHQVVNDLPLGRNIDEMLRMVDALQFTEEHGEVCPAGWQKGKAGMGASPEGVAKYLAEHAAAL